MFTDILPAGRPAHDRRAQPARCSSDEASSRSIILVSLSTCILAWSTHASIAACSAACAGVKN
jgi:hypothetical protein